MNNIIISAIVVFASVLSGVGYYGAQTVSNAADAYGALQHTKISLLLHGTLPGSSSSTGSSLRSTSSQENNSTSIITPDAPPNSPVQATISTGSLPVQQRQDSGQERGGGQGGGSSSGGRQAGVSIKALTANTFLVDVDSVPFTISVDNKTIIVDNAGNTIPFSALKLGDRIIPITNIPSPEPYAQWIKDLSI